jgi:aminopeptidase N
MKNYLTLFLIGTCAISLFAQKETAIHCSKRDHVNHAALKSNSLTIPQIAETEKYDVTYYSLDISMSNLVTTVAGTAQIQAAAIVPLDSALFELFNTFTISQIRVNGSPISYSRIGSAIKVPVNASVGQAFIIEVDYNGTPPTAATNPLGGSGITNATSPSWGNKVTWSLSEPFSAYEWWPCKQSLTDKADSCAVKVTVPSNCKAGSNGILEAVVDLGNGTKRFEWKHRHPIDYYLISVAVAKYVEYNVYANPVGAPAPILIQNFIYDNPATLSNFQADIDETVDFMELFSDLYGLYPFADEKYGHCMAPLSGGMEHQTMTTQGFFEKSLTAHELGHQWWGNNVTCASWADIWVNEGFASYSDFLMIENLYPAEKTQYMLDVHSSVMSQPDGSVYVLDSLNENRIFSGRLSYDKGSAIVHTMRFMLNNDIDFFQALKDFQVNFKDSVAKGLDVKVALETESGLNLTNMFNEWYFGEGYPTYSARWNSIGNDLLLEITHTASMPSVTPTFTNPLELRFSRVGLADTIIRFDINTNLDQYFVANAGNVTNIVSFDPNNWVINKVGTKIKDVNFNEIAGLNDLTANQELHISPNPTDGTISISGNFEGDAKLKIVASNGAVVLNKSVHSNTVIDLVNIESGVYFVEVIVSSTGEVKRTKLIRK